MATHSSILAWKIPRTEKPGRLQTTGSQRVEQDSAGTRAVIFITGRCSICTWFWILNACSTEDHS